MYISSAAAAASSRPIRLAGTHSLQASRSASRAANSAFASCAARVCRCSLRLVHAAAARRRARRPPLGLCHVGGPGRARASARACCGTCLPGIRRLRGFQCAPGGPELVNDGRKIEVVANAVGSRRHHRVARHWLLRHATRGGHALGAVGTAARRKTYRELERAGAAGSSLLALKSAAASEQRPPTSCVCWRGTALSPCFEEFGAPSKFPN